MAEAARYTIWDGTGAPADLSAVVFAGDLVLLRAAESVARLCDRAKRLVADAFDDADPETAETRLAPVGFRRCASAARKAVAADAELQDEWTATLRGVGYPIEELFLDRVRLRVVPSQSEARSRFARPLPIHRDSWGARIHAQINWWTPLFPLAATRTMLLWPDMLRTPIANSAAEWDYETLISGRVKDYPLLPEALDAPSRAPVPILIEPGELLAFAAAHLHGAVSDASGRTRFSLDTRTVWAGDIRAGRGAPNVDCIRKRPYWEMFAPAPEGALRELAENLDNHAIGGAP